MAGRKLLYNAPQVHEAIDRIADAILEEFRDEESIGLVGIYKQGVPLAERLQKAINRKSSITVELAKLDISMYRDDFGLQSVLSVIRETVIPFDLHQRKIILVDDVLSSGRTIRAALDAVTDYGRPALIRLAVLVDRNRPEYPIYADYAGFECDLPADRKVRVEFGDTDGNDAIYEKEWNEQA